MTDRALLRAQFRVNWKKQTIEGALKSAADAVGATLTEEEKRYVLRIDPRQYRSRAVALFRHALKRANQMDELARVEAEYVLALTPLLTDDLIRTAFRDPSSNEPFARNGVVLPELDRARGLALQRARILLSRGQPGVRDRFEAQITPESRIFGTVRDDGQIRVLYEAEDRTNRFEM